MYKNSSILTTPLRFLQPFSEKNIRVSTNNLYYQKPESLAYIFAADSYIFIQIFVVGSEKRIISAIEWVSKRIVLPYWPSHSNLAYNFHNSTVFERS